MRLKTSFFNGTVFRKNLTRFAPVWGLYALGLCMFQLLNFSTTTEWHRDFYMAYHMSEYLPLLSMANLGYGFLMAQLLFGDLYSSRMCNMLHAYPLRREGWYLTNLVSGLACNALPMGIAALCSYLTLAGSVFPQAWQLPLYTFLGSNLQFLVFFSLAVFATMCVGTRLTMAAGYALLNFGAYLGYFLVDYMLTPKLYGVITPTKLVNDLTPMVRLGFDGKYFEATMLEDVMDRKTGELMENAVATFQLESAWGHLLAWAGIGLVFLVLGLLLYRKRNLECAGDAVAFPILVPVFHVLCAISVGGALQAFLVMMTGLKATGVYLFVGIVVGWILGRMLTERSARIFRLKNFYGLAGLLAAVAVVLGGASVDVLGIEDRIPDAEDVASVVIHTHSIGRSTETEDIALAIQIHELALGNRAEATGIHILDENGEYVPYPDAYAYAREPSAPAEESPAYVEVTNVSLCYRMKDGRTIQRNYPLWPNSPEGELVKNFLSRWEQLSSDTIVIEGKKFNQLQLALDTFRGISLISGLGMETTGPWAEQENVDKLVACLKADAEAGNLSQDEAFHTGFFREERPERAEGYYDRSYIWLSIYGESSSWDIQLYPDCENTIALLQDLGQLDCEVHHTQKPLW